MTTLTTAQARSCGPKTVDISSVSGYQQAILYLNGSFSAGKFVVRNISRHYVDSVAPLFPTATPYLQAHSEDGRKDYWVIKSVHTNAPSLSDVTDWPGFCRGYVELQGSLDRSFRRKQNTSYPRLRIYGPAADLEALMLHLPANPKKIQYVSTNNGQTCAIYYQSKAEIADILNYLDGDPKFEPIWSAWSATMQEGADHGNQN